MIQHLETKESIDILSNNCIGHLAYTHMGYPYVLPITYFYDAENNAIISYSGVGHKINAMRKSPYVSVEVDEIKSLSNWKSITIQGTFEELSGTGAKKTLHEFTNGVNKILAKQKGANPKFINELSSKIVGDTNPVVFRINVKEITGKKRDA